jgi:hypothetical protein
VVSCFLLGNTHTHREVLVGKDCHGNCEILDKRFQPNNYQKSVRQIFRCTKIRVTVRSYYIHVFPEDGCHSPKHVGNIYIVERSASIFKF